jgi:hypothetical protein
VDLAEKTAKVEYYQQVKNHILNEGSIADVVIAARSTGLDSEKRGSVLKPVVEQLIREKVASPERLKVHASSLEKVAHRVVNDQHPLVKLAASVAFTQDEAVKLSHAIDEVESQMSKINSFLKENVYAGIAK